MSTPIVRAGPTSKLLKRRSHLAPPPAALSHSMRVLDDAMGSPTIHTQTEDVTRFIDMSRLNDTRFATRGDTTMMREDITRPLGPDQTAFLGEENPGVTATETLFDEFLSTSSSGNSGAAALDSIAEFEQMVSFIFHLLTKYKHMKNNFLLLIQWITI